MFGPAVRHWLLITIRLVPPSALAEFTQLDVGGDPVQVGVASEVAIFELSRNREDGFPERGPSVEKARGWRDLVNCAQTQIRIQDTVRGCSSNFATSATNL
jgi:hypothetical protein